MKIYYKNFLEQTNYPISEDTLLYWVRSQEQAKEPLFRLKAMKKVEIKDYLFDPLTRETQYWPMSFEDFYTPLFSEKNLKRTRAIRFNQAEMSYFLSDSRMTKTEIETIFGIHLVTEEDGSKNGHRTTKLIKPVNFDSQSKSERECANFVRSVRIGLLRQGQTLGDHLRELFSIEDESELFDKNNLLETSWDLFALQNTVSDLQFLLNQLGKVGDALHQLRKKYPVQIDYNAIQVIKGIYVPFDRVCKNLEVILEETNRLSTIDPQTPSRWVIKFFDEESSACNSSSSSLNPSPVAYLR